MNAEIRAVQRRERHIAHRLKSIAFDARRLEGKLGMLEDALEDLDSSKLRFLANERCGSWYLPSKSYFRRRHQLDDGAGEDSAHMAGTASTSMPPNSPTTCYFKSSDGHYGQWAFSTSRLNLAVVKPLLRSETSPELHKASIEPPSSTGSVTVIVDATQHGKAYPDSFSKTIPMWARVMNEAYFRNIDADAASPPSLLPPWLHPSEANSIAQRLPSFVSAFCAVCPPSLAPDVVHLEHPLTIVWLHGEDDDATWRKAADSVQLLSHNHHVLVLVCASGDATWAAAAKEGDLPPARHGWTYVRGAADDHQSWGMGLTCEIFWEHVDALTDPALSLDDVEESVEQIVKETISGQQASDAFTHSVDDTRKALDNALQHAVLISNDTSVPAVLLCAVVGVERPSPLASSPLQCFECLSASAAAAHVMEIGERRIAVMVLSDTKLKDPTPRITLFPLIHAAIVEVDSNSTKFGIQRAVPLCLEWLDKQLHHHSKDDDPSQLAPFSVCLLCVDGERDGHIVAAIASAMQAHLHHILSRGASPRHTKASLRIHQAAVADALGPRCIYRSDMIQLNRHFLSGEQ